MTPRTHTASAMCLCRGVIGCGSARTASAVNNHAGLLMSFIALGPDIFQSHHFPLQQPEQSQQKRLVFHGLNLPGCGDDVPHCFYCPCLLGGKHSSPTASRQGAGARSPEQSSNAPRRREANESEAGVRPLFCHGPRQSGRWTKWIDEIT